MKDIFGKEISRDTIAALRSTGFIASGPRSPTPGAPYTLVTTRHFLSAFGMETLRDLPDIEALEDAGLFNRDLAEYRADGSVARRTTARAAGADGNATANDVAVPPSVSRADLRAVAWAPCDAMTSRSTCRRGARTR